MADLLDFGGKYQYLQGVYHSKVNHELLQTIAVYTFTIGFGLITSGLVLLLLSSFGRDTIPTIQGCRRYGRKGKSRLADELSPKHTSTDKKTAPKVHSIWLFPIKSCRGVETDEAEIIPTGIRYDRHFSFAQLHSPFPLSVTDSQSQKAAHQWRFITQREFPLLSQVQTELWVPDPAAADYNAEAPYVKTEGCIVVRFPYEEDGISGMLKSFVARLRGSKTTRSFIIPFNPTPAQQKSYKLEEFKIWKDTPLSLNMDSILPPELKYFLGVRNPLTLFRVHNTRPIFRCAPRKQELGWQPITGFADAYPVNIMGLASLQAVSKMQPAGSPALSFLRFRGNIALSGCVPFDEEEWTKIQIADDVYRVCCRCVRCGIPNIDPDSGVKHKNQPYRTLVSQRNVDKGSPQYGCLGMQMVPERQNGRIRVGDVVRVLERGEHVYEPM